MPSRVLGTWIPSASRRRYTPRTRGIVVVHLYGHPVDMDPILELAERHGLWVIEDAAEAHGATYRDRIVGSMGSLSTFSFYGNKIITSGEGGMVVTRRRASWPRSCASCTARGRIRSADTGFRWSGFNYRMTNIEAAIGLAQLERIDWHLSRRREIAGWYREELGDEEGIELLARGALGPQRLLDHVRGARRATVRSARRCDGRPRQARDRDTAFLLSAPYAPDVQAANEGKAFPVAEDLGRRGMNLPSSATLTREDVAYVCAQLRKIKR